MDLLFDNPETSTAGGVINDVYTDVPNNSPDWTSAAAIFAEYRVLAMTVNFIPNIQGGNVAAIAYAPLYVVWDTGGVTALASYAAASNFPVTHFRALNQPWAITHKMNGVEEGLFVIVSSPVVDYSFKLFATGLTAVTNYGRCLVRWHVQFRGRQ